MIPDQVSLMATWQVLFYLVEGHVDVMDFSPIREAWGFCAV